MSAPRIGERVFVAETTGKYGKVTCTMQTPSGPRYMVDFGRGACGPFADVWHAPSKPA